MRPRHLFCTSAIVAFLTPLSAMAQTANAPANANAPAPDSTVFLAPDAKPDSDAPVPETVGGPVSTAGKMRDQYKKIGDAQKHVFGEGLPGSAPPNFNLKVPGVNAPAQAADTAVTPPAVIPPHATAPAPRPALPKPLPVEALP